MKHFALFCFILHSSLVSTQIKNIAIETPSSDFVFRGIENQLNIVVEGYSCNDLLFNVINAGYKWSGCTLIILPNDKALTCSIEIMDSAGQIIDTRNLFIRQQPNPVAVISGYGSANIFIEKNVIASATNIQLSQPELRNYGNIPVWFILSFTLQIEHPAGLLLEFENIGSEINEKAQSALQNCIPNSKVRISNVLASDPSGNEIRLANLQLVVQ